MPKTNPLNGENELNKKGLELSLEQKYALSLSAFGDFMSLVPTLAGGYSENLKYRFQAMQNNINAQQMRLDTRDIVLSGYEAENNARVQGARIKGQQKVAMGASGFEVGSKSYKDIVNATDRNIEMNAAAIRRQYTTQASALEASADMADIQASYYRQAGKSAFGQSITNALTTGLSGATKMAALRYFSGD